MPDEEKPVEEVVPVIPESTTGLDESFADALESQESTEEEKAEESKTVEAKEAETKVDDSDPEHIAWAKSVKGHYDPDKGFDTERITKQSFELHKQNQSQAENLRQLKEAFQHPEIAEVFRKVYLKDTAAPDGKATEEVKSREEKTSEEVLTEFVDTRYQHNFGGLASKIDLVYRTYMEGQYAQAKVVLEKEFPKYEEIKDQVGQAMVATAKQANVSVDQLLEYLVQNGKLIDILQSTARNIVYPGLKTKVDEEDKEKVAIREALEKKKRASLTGRGSPTTEVSKTKVESMNFEEALEAAEEELAAG